MPSGNVALRQIDAIIPIALKIAQSERSMEAEIVCDFGAWVCAGKSVISFCVLKLLAYPHLAALSTRSSDVSIAHSTETTRGNGSLVFPELQ